MSNLAAWGQNKASVKRHSMIKKVALASLILVNANSMFAGYKTHEKYLDRPDSAYGNTTLPEKIWAPLGAGVGVTFAQAVESSHALSEGICRRWEIASKGICGAAAAPGDQPTPLQLLGISVGAMTAAVANGVWLTMQAPGTFLGAAMREAMLQTHLLKRTL